MNRTRLIRFLSAVLLAGLSAFSCRQETPESQQAELQVALYIPDAVMTRADDPSVNPLADEIIVTTLHIWVFLHDTGELVSYKLFNHDLDQSGLSHSTITRFGLPLTDEMFKILTTESGTPPTRPAVDVYALANAASALSGPLPDEHTSQADLEALVVNGIGGTSPLTMSVPIAGLPMSGVRKNVPATGGYPVLNITAIKLTRAVSKIRFVFCQQVNPANGNTPATPVKDNCQIISIQFDGVDSENEKDCQIANTERLFTNQAFDIGDSPSYSTLNAKIAGQGGNPLISKNQLARSEDPEGLFYQSPGHDTESVEQYEKRLATALDGYPNSQVGPIYLRETNKRISGTITYQIEDKVDKVPFVMDADVFPRNHSWLVYACFAQKTMSLELKVVPMPWDYTTYSLNYITNSVNVIRRFTVSETNPPRFVKKETKDGFFDVTFWHTIQIDDAFVENVLHGDIIIATPVGGILHAVPVPKTIDKSVACLEDAFIVELVPSSGIIYPNHISTDDGIVPNGVIEDCLITIIIKANTNKYSDIQLEGNCIDLHFYVETSDGREIDLGSESIDYYRFILSEDWNIPESTESNNND